jgi:hypothetical protein
MNDLDYLYAHHAVGLCPEERCVTARANLAALVEGVAPLVDYADRMAHDLWGDWELTNGPLTNEAGWQRIRAALQGRVASREGSGTP